MAEDSKKPTEAVVEGVASKIKSKPRAKKNKAAQHVTSGRVYVQATYNNTIVSVTDERGNLVAWSSAGALGFAGPKKATPFAASKIVATVVEKIKKSGPHELSVYVNGFGGGRDSAIRSFINQGFIVTSITDVTPIPHNGVRAPKPRRI